MLCLSRSSLLILLLLASATGLAVEPVPASCARLAAGLPDAERKFNHGHYIAVSKAEAGNLQAAAATTGISGVQRRYRWALLEPRPDAYDLTAIERDLEMMARSGVQLVAMIEDKTFDGTVPTPPYLRGEHTLRGKRGYIANRWDPLVIDRLTRLVAAIGARFDCHPNFEGIAFQETAVGLEPAALRAAGYTPEKYRDSLITLLQGATDGLQRSRVFWYMNFLPGKQQYLDDIAIAVAGTGVVMGGPDILPDNAALAQRVYPIYSRFEGRMKLFGSMQHDSYRHPRGLAGITPVGSDLWSMEDLFLFARDRLHVDYVFWEYRTRRSPPDARGWDEAHDVIVRFRDFHHENTGGR